ncbi:hypothetical protein GYH30_009772 [Glycine max]|nr:hypothetical protein GYH30_009772 [Glycine max]
MESRRDPLFHLTIRTDNGYWAHHPGTDHDTFYVNVTLLFLPIGASLNVPPIEVPLPLIVIDAHATRYTYITPTSLTPSCDSLTSFDSSSFLNFVHLGTNVEEMLSDTVVPMEAFPTLNLILLVAQAPSMIVIEDSAENSMEEDPEKDPKEGFCVESSQGSS